MGLTAARADVEDRHGRPVLRLCRLARRAYNRLVRKSLRIPGWVLAPLAFLGAAWFVLSLFIDWTYIFPNLVVVPFAWWYRRTWREEIVDTLPNNGGFVLRVERRR